MPALRWFREQFPKVFSSTISKHSSRPSFISLGEQIRCEEAGLADFEIFTLALIRSIVDKPVRQYRDGRNDKNLLASSKIALYSSPRISFRITKAQLLLLLGCSPTRLILQTLP